MRAKFARVVAIDGPSGSGKSTVAKKLAQQLNLLYIDTGAMYRGVALFFHQQGVVLKDSDQVFSVLEKLKLSYGPTEDQLIFLDGINCSEKIREHFVSQLASQVGQLAPVRQAMVDLQRRLVEDQGRVCVMEGRDIATVVFPNAFIKFFLHAGEQVRAQRRLFELEQRGEAIDFQKVQKDMMARDKEDCERQLAPLSQDVEAITIDSTDLTIEQAVGQMKEYTLARAKELGVELVS